MQYKDVDPHAKLCVLANVAMQLRGLEVTRETMEILRSMVREAMTEADPTAGDATIEAYTRDWRGPE